MEALSPYTRALSIRKLDFEDPKLVQGTPDQPIKKRARPHASKEPLVFELDGSLLRDEKKTQKEGPSTYIRRRSRQVLQKDVPTVKNVTLTVLPEGEAKLSSNGSSSLRSSMQAEAFSNPGTRGEPDGSDVTAKPSPGLAKNGWQALHGDMDLQTQGFEIANSLLSTTRCLDVVPIDISPLSHTVDTAIVYEGPYPSFPRPLPEECSEVCHRLSLLHGPLEEYAKHKVLEVSDNEVLQLEYHKEEDFKGNPLSTDLQLEGPRLRSTVLDSLVGTMLSQNTTDTNSRRAFASLKAKFPTWELVYEADPKAVEDSIRCGGLAEIKTSRILNILRVLDQERGKLCLEYVRKLSTDEIKLELSRFKGVGPKTIACVLMFHLQQNEFPVDTHVFRITKMLGWVPAKADREKAYLHLNHRIPHHLKFDLHCLLVTHGKRCPRCAKGGRARKPADGPCPLVNLKQQLLEKADCDLLLEP